MNSTTSGTRITIGDVAARAGVSIATVSRVVNERYGVAAATSVARARGDRRARLRVEPRRPQPAQPAHQRHRHPRGRHRAVQRRTAEGRRPGAARPRLRARRLLRRHATAEEGWERRYLSRLERHARRRHDPRHPHRRRGARRLIPSSPSTPTSAARRCRPSTPRTSKVRVDRDRAPARARPPAHRLPRRAARPRVGAPPRGRLPRRARRGRHRLRPGAGRGRRLHRGDRRRAGRARCSPSPDGPTAIFAANDLSAIQVLRTRRRARHRRARRPVGRRLRQHPRVGAHRSAAHHRRPVDPGARRRGRAHAARPDRTPDQAIEPIHVTLPTKLVVRRTIASPTARRRASLDRRPPGVALEIVYQPTGTADTTTATTTRGGI